MHQTLDGCNSWKRSLKVCKNVLHFLCNVCSSSDFHQIIISGENQTIWGGNSKCTDPIFCFECKSTSNQLFTSQRSHLYFVDYCYLERKGKNFAKIFVSSKLAHMTAYFYVKLDFCFLCFFRISLLCL